MTTAARNIEELKKELKDRRQIYEAWLASLDHEGADSLVPYLEGYPVFYFRLKKYGLYLPPEIERRLVGSAQALTSASVTVKDLELAEEAGIFEELDPRFARWIAVAWGRLACREYFLRLGVNSRDFLEALELQLVLGAQAEAISDPRRIEITLLLGEVEVETILKEGLATRAELFAFIDAFVKADKLAA